MGLFSSKKKTVIGVSALDLGYEGYTEYSKFRRDLAFAVDGDSEMYMMEMFKYKQRTRNKYSSTRLEMYGISPISATISLETETTVNNMFADNPDYFNLRYPEPVEPRNAEFQDDNDPEIPLALDEAMKAHRGIEGFGSATEMYIPNISENGWTTNVHAASNDSIEAYFLVYTGSSQYYSEPNLNNVSFKIYHQRIHMDNGVPEHDETVIIYNYTNKTYDLKEYAWNGLAVYTTGFDEGLEIFRMDIDLLDDTTTQTTEMEFEPLISLKEANSSTLFDPVGDCQENCPDGDQQCLDDCEDLELTQEEREKAFYQKKILDSVGMNLDSVETYVKNDKIQDLKIGMMYNLEKINENHGITESFFDSLELISNSTGRFNIGANNIDNDEIYPVNALSTVMIPFDNMDMELTFQLDRVERESTIPIEAKKKCKIKLISNSTLLDTNTPDMIELYEGLYGSSAGLTVHEMREAVVSDYNSTDNPSEELDEAYSSLPTVRDLTTLYDKIELVLYIPEYTTIAEIEEYLLELDEDKYANFTVDSFRYIDGTAETARYRYDVKKQYVTAVSRYDDFDGNENMTKYRVRRLDTSTNQEIVFVLTGLKLKYSDADGHEYTSYCEEDGATFIFPVPYGSLDNKSFYDFIELYDAMLTGVAFSVQTIKIKWYQRGWFAVFIQIIMVVIAVAITVLTAGAGATVGTILMNFAINYAIAYAVSTAVVFIAEQLGVDSSIAAIASLIITAAITGNTEGILPQLGLTVADAALKYQAVQYQQDTERIMRQQKELDKKIKHISLLMNQEDKSISTWAIIANAINRTDALNPTNSTVNITEESNLEAQEKEKYSVMPSANPLPLDMQELALGNLNHAESQYDVEYDIGNIRGFGDITNG